jgi:short-subunit dehydrogenase
MTAWDGFCTLCGVVVSASLLCYLAPLFVLTYVLGPQDLRRKYGAWALVTGGSSGIGLSVARRLAAQGVSVCIAALDDPHLPAAVSALRAEYPAVEIRPVPVDLAGDPAVYVAAVAAATRDVPVAIVVNNAGFLRMAYFDEVPVDGHAANLECNAIAAVRITHLLYSRMIAENRRGCLVFTSSAAWFMPAPFALIYGASKAMLSNFATSLAIEAKNHGVDVLTVHPSYTHTNLYETNPKIGVLDVLSKVGWTADDVAAVMFTSVGRVLVRDAGAYSVATNLLGRAVDAGTLAAVIAPFRSSFGPPPRTVTAARH